VIEFKLPSLGSDMDEGTLVAWHVAPGQAVKKGDVIAVVDTTKAAIDVECWHDGVVDRLLTQVGEKIPVGTVMALLRAAGEAVPEPAAPQVAVPGRLRVTPAARQRAAELGVDLAGVSGTGEAGAITRDDVERAATSAPTHLAPKPVPAPMPEAASAPMPTMAERAAEMRRSIAAAMSRSKREIPHYYLSESVPMRRALDWLRHANAERPVSARLLPAVLLLKAVALTLRDFPEMNGRFADGTFRPASAAHIGVAISLRQGGLVAPALHDVGSKPLDNLMRELADLVKRCRAGSLRSSEMSDPTITVTNLGDEGVESVFGVIYPPQVALVGFGRVADRPWVEGGAVVAMPVLCATLAADHRVSDGHRGAMFLARLRDRLQAPDELQGERLE
jgi:pyruvate dehydrogenase E2 component (dihydrolipoamide acetyltransferase)